MIRRQCCMTFQNLLSCMTLDMENFHSTVHVKQANMSKAEYCRSFGLAMKEAVKRVPLGQLIITQAGDLVSQTEGRFVAIAGSCHETSTNCQYVSSRLQCSQKLGVLLWGCRKTTNGTPRDHHGTSWHTPRIYVPKAMRDLR